MDEYFADLVAARERRIMGTLGVLAEVLEGEHSSRAVAVVSQAVLNPWARLAAGRTWTNAPTATPLADLRTVQLLRVPVVGRIDAWHLPRRLAAAARYRAWWRALPRRDKRALRRRGLTAAPC